MMVFNVFISTESQLLDWGNVQLIFWTIIHDTCTQRAPPLLVWETNLVFFFFLSFIFTSLLQSWDLIVHDVKAKPSILHQTPKWLLEFPRIWVGYKEAETVFVVCHHSRCIDPLNTHPQNESYPERNTDGIMVKNHSPSDCYSYPLHWPAFTYTLPN